MFRFVINLPSTIVEITVLMEVGRGQVFVQLTSVMCVAADQVDLSV